MREENILIGMQAFRKQLHREEYKAPDMMSGVFFVLKDVSITNPVPLSLLRRVPLQK